MLRKTSQEKTLKIIVVLPDCLSRISAYLGYTTFNISTIAQTGISCQRVF